MKKYFGFNPTHSSTFVATKASNASRRSSIWGNGSAGNVTVSDSYILPLFSMLKNYTVYGRVPGSQIVPPGTYQDTITVTVTF